MTTSATAWRQPATPGWRRVGRSLVRELSFRDFDEAFGFVQRVANEAVDYVRRPDICIFGFNRVRLTVANPHNAGLTEAELRLAGRVDAILTADEHAASSGSQRAATDGRAWAVPPTRSARLSRTTSARRVVQQIVVICVLLTLAEFVTVALLVAPRAVARKLLSPVRALLRRARRLLGARSPRREPARPSREGT